MLILGLDIGGTTSRALLVTTEGRRLTTGTAAGGNPVSHQVAEAVAAVGAALAKALRGVDARQVRAAVIGTAGVGRLEEPAVRREFEAMWHRAGLRCPYRTVSDALVAFAAGTPAPDGTLLLAGTGAIAGQVQGRTMRRYADGYGWLLGDLGSGFWLGRQAVRACLAYLDGWAPDTSLVRRVLTELVGVPNLQPGREGVNRVVNAVRREPPVALARFARAVDETAAGGDPVAREIVSRASGHLLASAAQVRGDAPDAAPLVLAGGLLSGDTVLAGEVRAEAARRWPGVTIRTASDGAAGAAWLAALALHEPDPEPGLTPEELHARLLAPGPSSP